MQHAITRRCHTNQPDIRRRTKRNDHSTYHKIVYQDNFCDGIYVSRQFQLRKWRFSYGGWGGAGSEIFTHFYAPISNDHGIVFGLSACLPSRPPTRLPARPPTLPPASSTARPPTFDVPKADWSASETYS
ncbi:hypothetical protein DPMN_039963 [Dreissena polymorpha]|uniref:Uncharacterized protein n=1 Tax=Dreissena polymorpha TaxID=45954 RepID=A0A9D4CWU8_DREPO|nr:hypothetical protein DPMN_039963 [Dreissena polymorpha]